MKILYNTIEVPVPNTLVRIFGRNKLLYLSILGGLVGTIILLIVFVCYYAKRLNH